MLGADCKVSPAFIHKSTRHKYWATTVRYIDPTIGEALCANDRLCGNYLQTGWDQSYTGHRQSLSKFLSKNLVKNQTYPGSVGMVGDAGGVANMAAKLGALYLAKEQDQDLAKAKVPPSAPAASTSKPLSVGKNLVSNLVPGVGPPPVRTSAT